MRIPLDRKSTLPVYRQIEGYLRQGILNGTLAVETRLPSTRELAQELGVSRITVKNAYAELEADGLIGGQTGSGTYVLAPISRLRSSAQQPVDLPAWQQALLMNEEPSQTVPPERKEQSIAFTGVGDPRQFPVRDFNRALQTVIHRDGLAALEYGDFNRGYPPLRETIAHVLASQGIQTSAENILITSGSQQALSLLCQVLLQPGDTVLVENPTYNFALDLFRSYRLNLVGVPVDEQGMQVERVEELLRKYAPKMIYTIPNFQNPSGACMSGARRRQLVALADRCGVPLVEDDFAGDLRYDGRAQPAIKALDPGGRVIYVGTFSKMLMPGLRVGFLAADGPVFKRLIQCKRVNDLSTSPLIQRTLDLFVTVGRYQAHLRRSIRLYRARRDAMTATVKHDLPPEVEFFSPQGGLFLWLRLPQNQTASRLLIRAGAEGVEVSPGTRFFIQPQDGEHYLRLNFAVCTPEEIEEGMRRLGRAFISGSERT